MKPIFDKPEWSIRQDPAGEQTKMGMSNLVEVSTDNDNDMPYEVAIIIPSEFFSFARDILKVEKLDNLKFYLDAGDPRYYFGVCDISSDRAMADIDLWYYTRSTLPDVFKN